MQTIEQKLEENAVAVLLHISMWQPRRGNRNAIKKGAEDAKLIHAALHSTEFRRIQALNKKIRRYHAGWTWPWQGNFTLLPIGRYADYSDMMVDFITQYETATEDFAKLVDTMRLTAKTDAFPTGEYIRMHNQVTLNFVQASMEDTAFAEGDLRERVMARNLHMFEAGVVARLQAILKWMARQADPEDVEHLAIYNERERQRCIIWCQSLIELGLMSPMHQDVTNQTLAALMELPDSVSFDDKKHEQFFQRINDLQALLG